MEGYQFGKHLALEKILENKNYYAELFSEGNADLKRILTYCFDHNIGTYMCCTGHFNDEDEFEEPFIMLNIPYSNKELIYSIVSSLYDVEDVFIKIGKKYEKDVIELDARSYCSNRFFKKFYKGITNLNNAKNVAPEVIKIVETLNQFNHPPYDLYFRSSYVDGSMQYETWVDYVYDTGEKRGRDLFVLSKRMPCANVEQCFSQDVLNDYAKTLKQSKM